MELFIMATLEKSSKQRFVACCCEAGQPTTDNSGPVALLLPQLDTASRPQPEVPTRWDKRGAQLTVDGGLQCNQPLLQNGFLEGDRQPDPLRPISVVTGSRPGLPPE